MEEEKQEITKDALIEHIESKIDYFLDKEESRASVNDYGPALYYNHQRGALEDLLAWVRIQETRKTKQMELTLYKAHRADGKGEIEGDLITNPSTNISDCILLINGKLSPFIEIKPETISIYTGLNAEWFNEGVDPRIWSGDLFEIEHSYIENTQWKVIYKNAAFYVQRLDDQEIEKLLFDFISDNVYKKIGSIHDEKEGK